MILYNLLLIIMEVIVLLLLTNLIILVNYQMKLNHFLIFIVMSNVFFAVV